jgi:hypothetical protein
MEPLTPSSLAVGSDALAVLAAGAPARAGGGGTRRAGGGRVLAALLVCAALLGAGVARAHVTPPVRLASDRDAVARLLAGARELSVREVRLSKAERASVERRTGRSPDEDLQRFHLGRDADGRLVGAVVFVTEYTMHGPIRMAVGLDPHGRVTGAGVVELSEETYPWVRPLLEHDLLREYVGEDARSQFAPSDRVERAVTGAMPRFYARVLASLVRRAALLFEVGMLERAAR